MAAFFEKVKSVFKKAEAKNTVKPTSNRKSSKKVKRKVLPEKVIEGKEQIKASVEANGYHSISVKSLFKVFGYQQRGSVNILKVNQWLNGEGLYAFPKLTAETEWVKALKIYKFPVEQLGDLFKSELEMEDKFVQNKWYEQLDLIINPEGDRQYKPQGSRDRLDFKARDAFGNDVVLELKHKGGDKRIIEQVFRYRSLLMSENANAKNVRCVIVTGNRCLHTARAIHGELNAQEQSQLKWYLYNYNSQNESISFEEVTIDFLSKHLLPVSGTQK